MIHKPLLLLLFSLSSLSLLIVSSAQEKKHFHQRCPPFQCRNFGPIGFPFKNSADTHCGFYTVDCKEQNNMKIQLKEGGHLYKVEWISQSNNVSQPDTVTIKPDTALKDYLVRCESMESFGLPMPSAVARVTANNSLTVLNCSHSEYISDKDLQHTKCGDFDIFLKNQRNINFQNFTPKCSFIQIPDQDRVGILITLQVHVIRDCFHCHNTGGQCLTNYENKFYCSKSNEGFMLKAKLAIGITCFGVGVLFLFFCCLRKKLSSSSSGGVLLFWKKKNPTDRNIKEFLRNCEPLKAKRYSYWEVKEMTKSFKEKLGQGGFGCVYKGKLHDGRLVAVKMLNESKASGEDFINEVATISQTSHVNVVSLLGFCFECSKKALVYEFMPNGSLEKFVYNEDTYENSLQLDWKMNYRISLGIARGLEYLHRGCNTRILHLDIKPHNILLDADFVPKISDFGLAKICGRKESLVSMACPRGTIGYIAPEFLYRNFGGVSHKSDVYSYGMMILEMIGGRRNINVRGDNSSEIYFPHWIYKRLEVDEELGLKRVVNEEERARVRKMIITSLWCIQTRPLNRPAMSRVIEMLQGNPGSLEVPPKPFFSSPSQSPEQESC